MERDQRITGVFRGQSEAVEAPAGFEGRLLLSLMMQSLTVAQ